jgi:hypothetical protein
MQNSKLQCIVKNLGLFNKNFHNFKLLTVTLHFKL